MGCRDKDGWQPLHLAASSGNVAVLQLLLEAGAGVECTTNDGRTPVSRLTWPETHTCVFVALLRDEGSTCGVGDAFERTWGVECRVGSGWLQSTFCVVHLCLVLWAKCNLTPCTRPVAPCWVSDMCLLHPACSSTLLPGMAGTRRWLRCWRRGPGTRHGTPRGSAPSISPPSAATSPPLPRCARRAPSPAAWHPTAPPRCMWRPPWATVPR